MFSDTYLSPSFQKYSLSRFGVRVFRVQRVLWVYLIQVIVGHRWLPQGLSERIQMVIDS